jgi:Ca2+-binding RTX toxin-like protein
LVLNALEPRLLFASLAVSLEDGVLTVVGTQEDDVIVISVNPETKKLRVQLDSDTDFSTSSARVQTIVVRARLGNDRVTIDPAVGATGQISGGGGNDVLTGGRKAWQLEGDSGHDTLFGGPGRDLFFGGAGIDTIDYSTRTEGVRVSLDGKPNDGAPAKDDKAKGERDNLAPDIENVIGGAGGDKFIGNELRNVLKGRGGDDTLIGGAGDDVLSGDEGADLLQGEDGDDVLIAIDHTIDDKLDGGEGYDAGAFDYVGAFSSTDAVLDVESEISVLIS